MQLIERIWRNRKHEKRIKRFGHTTSYGLDFQSQAK